MKPSFARTALALITALLLSAAFAQGEGTEQEQSPAAADDPVVIRVGATEERISDLAWRFEVALRNLVAQQGQQYTPEVAQQLIVLLPSYLEQRSQELALVKEARRRGYAADTERIDSEIETVREGAGSEEAYAELLSGAGFPSETELRTMLEEAELVNQLVTDIQTAASENLTENALRARYLADKSAYRADANYCARHILVEDKALAEELLERLGAGEEFAELAAEYGTDGTKSRGGDLGCFGEGTMVAEFQEAVESAEVGEPVGPVETQFGYHLLLVYDRTDERVESFEEARERVAASAAALATEAAIDGIIRGSGVTTYPERIPGL